MSNEVTTPRDIVSALLHKSGQAFLNDDFDALHACILLPYHVETFEGTRLISTAQELRELFQGVRAHQLKTNVTDMDRHVVEAVFSGDDTVLTTFETRLLNGTQLTQAPYPVFMVVKRDQGTWKAQQMTFAIEDRPDHNEILLSVGEKDKPPPHKQQGFKTSNRD